MRWGRLILASLVAELVPIVSLVALVAMFGPEGATERQAFAMRLGAWVGPLIGALAVFVMARWTAKGSTSMPVANGIGVGAMTALYDLTLLLASGGGYRTLFVVSQLGRVIAGALGGWSVRASRR